MLETRNVPRQASGSTAITPPPHARARTHTYTYTHTAWKAAAEQTSVTLTFHLSSVQRSPRFCLPHISYILALLPDTVKRFIPSFSFFFFTFSFLTLFDCFVFMSLHPFSKIVDEQIQSLERIKGEPSSTVVRNPLLYKV